MPGFRTWGRQAGGGSRPRTKDTASFHFLALGTLSWSPESLCKKPGYILWGSPSYLCREGVSREGGRNKRERGKKEWRKGGREGERKEAKGGKEGKKEGESERKERKKVRGKKEEKEEREEGWRVGRQEGRKTWTVSNYSSPCCKSPPSWGPRYCRAETSHLHCSLSQFLTHRLEEGVIKWWCKPLRLGMICYVAADNPNDLLPWKESRLCCKVGKANCKITYMIPLLRKKALYVASIYTQCICTDYDCNAICHLTKESILERLPLFRYELYTCSTTNIFNIGCFFNEENMSCIYFISKK